MTPEECAKPYAKSTVRAVNTIYDVTHHMDTCTHMITTIRIASRRRVYTRTKLDKKKHNEMQSARMHNGAGVLPSARRVGWPSEAASALIKKARR